MTIIFFWSHDDAVETIGLVFCLGGMGVSTFYRILLVDTRSKPLPASLCLCSTKSVMDSSKVVLGVCVCAVGFDCVGVCNDSCIVHCRTVLGCALRLALADIRTMGVPDSKSLYQLESTDGRSSRSKGEAGLWERIAQWRCLFKWGGFGKVVMHHLMIV